MFKKTKNSLALSLSVAMLATLVTIPGVASAATSKQLAGKDRYETALKIVQDGWEKSENAVIARGDVMADALAAAPLAYAKGKAPILLTKTNEISTEVLKELKDLGVKNVYIVGGIGAVSKAVADKLATEGLTVKRLEGKDRVATSLAIAKEAFSTSPAEVVIANGISYADALSVSSVAASKGMPILLVINNKLSAEQATYIAGKTVYAVGGTGVLNAAVVTEAKATRLAGDNRYDTNAAILKQFKQDYSSIYVAKGTDANLVDALAGSALAALKNNPVVLVDGNSKVASTKLVEVVTANITDDSMVVRLGGTVTQVAVDAIEAMKPQKLAVKSVNAINATQLKVVFTKAVDEVDAETAANYKIGSYVVTAELQADAKTVILTSTAPITGTNLYVVNPIKSVTDATVKTPIFTFVETYTDTVAPAVLSVTYPTFDKATVTFSEPITSLGTVTVTQNGAPLALSLTTAFVAGSSSITYDLAPAEVIADKAITIVMVGAKDTGNNLINPNPTTLTIIKTKTDITAPTISAINVLSDTRVSITFNEKLSVAPTVTVGGNVVSFAAVGSTTDNITWTGVFATTTGVLPVAVTAFADMSGNAGTASTVLKQVTADTVKPTLVSSEIKTFNSKLYLVLHYSEAVDAVIGGKIITGTTVKDYVSTSFTTGTAVTPVAYTKVNGADIDDTKSVMLDLSDNVMFPLGAYTVSVPALFVQDKASTTLYNDAASITFTKGTVTATDTTAPTVNALPVVSLDNKFVTVTFSEAMDYATALNVANYKVSGQTIFTNAIFDGNNKTVKLTVAPGTVTYSGDRQVTVSGAKDLAGNLNTSYSDIVSFKENVAPFVASAKLTAANTILVTFSENVAATTATDFEVYVAGVLVTTGATTSISAVSTSTATITLATSITDLSKAIQVKLVNAATVDANGNKATINQLIAVQ